MIRSNVQRRKRQPERLRFHKLNGEMFSRIGGYRVSEGCCRPKGYIKKHEDGFWRADFKPDNSAHLQQLEKFLGDLNA